MLVQQFLEVTADRLPEKIALIVSGHRYTYASIEAAANRLANCLVENGLQSGDRVALFLQNSFELVVSIFGALKAGGVFVVLNSTTKPDKLGYILENCQASALVTHPRLLPVAEEALENTRVVKQLFLAGERRAEAKSGWISLEDILATGNERRPAARVSADDLACLIYTSGSTGEPKGVMSAHANVDFATSSIVEYLHNQEDDILINILPLSFDYGLYQLLMCFKFGGTLVLERGFAYPALILQRIAEERVTGFPGVPTVYSMLLSMDLSPYDLSSLRYLTNTAAALPPSQIEALRQKFPWARLYSMYGLTETKRTLYLPPEEVDHRPGSVGIAIPGTEVWLEDEAGNRLGPGEVGELVVRGPHVMRGYWGDEEATRQRFRPGLQPGERLCYTGDLFQRDEEGYYYFVARKDDIIKSRGEKVAPKEVEAVLYHLPGVSDAAVIGVPDPVLGQAIKAFVAVRDPGLTEAEIMRHCKANLEDYMVPRFIQIVDELPKTESGKITKKDLR